MWELSFALVLNLKEQVLQKFLPFHYTLSFLLAMNVFDSLLL